MAFTLERSKHNLRIMEIRFICKTESVGLTLTLANPGSMLSESTTTTGDSLPVTHINPFQIINADVTIKPEAKRRAEKKR